MGTEERPLYIQRPLQEKHRQHISKNDWAQGCLDSRVWRRPDAAVQPEDHWEYTWGQARSWVTSMLAVSQIHFVEIMAQLCSANLVRLWDRPSRNPYKKHQETLALVKPLWILSSSGMAEASETASFFSKTGWNNLEPLALWAQRLSPEKAGIAAIGSPRRSLASIASSQKPRWQDLAIHAS